MPGHRFVAAARASSLAVLMSRMSFFHTCGETNSNRHPWALHMASAAPASRPKLNAALADCPSMPPTRSNQTQFGSQPFSRSHRPWTSISGLKPLPRFTCQTGMSATASRSDPWTSASAPVPPGSTPTMRTRELRPAVVRCLPSFRHGQRRVVRPRGRLARPGRAGRRRAGSTEHVERCPNRIGLRAQELSAFPYPLAVLAPTRLRFEAEQ